VKRIITGLLLSGCSPAPVIEPPIITDGEGEGEPIGEGEGEPACPQITGTASVTFTTDEGATLVPTSTALSGTIYTYGLVALDEGRVVAESGGRLLRSDDDGCSWRDIGAAPTTPMVMTHAGDVVYAWADNGSALARIEDDNVTMLTPPPGSIHGLGAAGDELVIGVDATLLRSLDQGNSWQPMGVPALSDDPSSLLVYRTTFANLNHAVVGTAGITLVTFDGGDSWSPSTGLSTGRSNVFNVVMSPVDNDVVWAQGIDIVESLQVPLPSHEGRHVWRSEDGGRSFVVVVDQTPAVVLINGSIMAAHPNNQDVLYFVFGTYFGGYGTDLHRYDHTTLATTMTHNDNHDIAAIAFSPDDDKVMYLGLVHEEIN
jgi:hypothetical protein